MEENPNLFLVLLKMDGGSAIVACTELAQDPLFPGKVVLANVQGLSWPFQDRFLGVHQWSMDKDVVINWMVGPLEQAPALTAELLAGEGQQVPWPPGSQPSAELVTKPETFNPAPTPAPPKDTPPSPGLQPISVLGR